MAQNRIEQRPHVFARLFGIEHGIAVERGSIDNRKVQLLVGRAQFVEQIECVIDDPIRPRTWPVDFVDHNNGFHAW